MDRGRPHVVVALELDEMARCGDFVEQLNLRYGDVDVVSPMRGLPLVGTQATHYFAHDVLTLRLYNNLARPWTRVIKRGFDLVAASALLLAAAPFFAVIAWRIRREGDGPIFYGHARIGQGGQPFVCYKFRSMVANADEMLARILESDPKARAEWEADHKLHNDPRITKIGRWLRKTSLDELPQLWNVLRGEMSLVGPRPIVKDELARYGKHLVYYTESKPGMTGLWQISGRSNLDYRRRVALDCWYTKNWTIWYDIIILLKTAKVVLRRQGAC
jgi:undecaprenyl-phosphate galactose phosphotransferase